MKDITAHLLTDGTYKSPKNGKIYKSKKSFISHLSYKGHVIGNEIADRLYKVKCEYCDRNIFCCAIDRHRRACYLNPNNMVRCLLCNTPIKNYKTNKGTCSHSCANSYFRHYRNTPEKYKDYRSICWHYHEKKCVVCNERNIVAVHHLNENHDDNRPENLVPLCPTHHSYMHSSYKNLIEDDILQYVEVFKLSVVK